MSASNKVLKNTGILYARMGITVFISLYSTRLILASLGVNDFGIFNVVAGAIAMLTFLNNAMATATQRFMSFSEGAGDINRKNDIYKVSVILHFIVAILVFIILEGIGIFLFDEILEIQESRINAAIWTYHCMVASTIFTVIFVPDDAVLNAHENMLAFAIFSIIESVLKLINALLITYFNEYDKLMTFSFMTAISTILILLLRKIYCYKKYDECKINFNKIDLKLFNEMRKFGGWSFLGATSSMISNYGQGIVLNTFFGTTLNAAQGVANQISGQLGAFASTMQKALNPMIVKSEGAGNRERMIKASMTGSKISFFLLLYFFVPVFIEMPFIFMLWLKNIPEYATIFCRLLLIRNLIDQLFITLTSAISAQGNIKKFQISASILWILPILITYFLFLLGYPPITMYLAFIIYSCFAGYNKLYFSRKNLGLDIKIFRNDVLVRSFACLVLVYSLAIIPIYFIESGLIRLVVVFMTSSISYLIVIYTIGLNSYEKEILIEKIKIRLINFNVKYN